MSKFKFKLQALKRLRKNRLDVARRYLHEFQNKLYQAQEIKTKNEEERSTLIKDVTENPDSASKIRLSGFLIGIQCQRIFKNEHEIVGAEQEFERHRKWVTELGREHKIIEKLEEKKREEFEKEKREREKRQIDTWVVERWSPKQ